MKGFDQDKYLKALDFAALHHDGQSVLGTGFPYLNHLFGVSMEVMACIASGDGIDDCDLAVICAVLHDTIEDTKVDYSMIEKEFGKKAADGVLALTKNDNLGSNEEKIKDSLARIKKQPREIWIVKLADRINNLKRPPESWSRIKIENYKKMSEIILVELGFASSFLSKRLDNKIKEYSSYII